MKKLKNILRILKQDIYHACKGINATMITETMQFATGLSQIR
nr:MAG TPA: hypothetical protein [Caudoviricetes sp.]